LTVNYIISNDKDVGDDCSLIQLDLLFYQCLVWLF